MRKLIATVAVLGAMTVISTSASAITLTNHVVQPHGITGKADRHQVVVTTVAPPDSDQDGVADSADNCPSTPGEASYNGCPPPPPKPSPVAQSTSTAPVVQSVAPAPVSSGGCPSSMSGEASSPTAVNSSSGASGCYQVLPSTAAAMGSACSDVNAPSCVAAICAAQGNEAWAASGSTPCG